MAHQPRAPGSIGSTQVVAHNYLWLTTICNSSCRGTDAFLWPLWVSGTRANHPHMKFLKRKNSTVYFFSKVHL